jgi:hypothetical protein
MIIQGPGTVAGQVCSLPIFALGAGFLVIQTEEGAHR